MQAYFTAQHTPPALNPRLLLLLCAAYLLLGLLDHDLWKYEDAVHLGVAWDMASRGHWLQPQLAGEAWPGAPLYYWLAAIFGNLGSVLFDFHNAARLATAACGALTLHALGRASALNLHGPRSDNRFDVAAPLLLIGAPGLIIPIHEAQPMIAVLAGQALVYWGLVQLPHLRKGAFILASGLIISVLADGLDALLPLAPLVLLPLFGPWRQRAALIGWGIAAALAIPAIVVASLLFNLPPITYPTNLSASTAHLELLGWYAWPMLPLALWSVWVYRRNLTSPPAVLPLLGSLGALLWFFAYAEPRNLPALPLLLPLTLLAALGAGRLRRGAANALDWFGMMTFTLGALILWLGEIALLTGVPPKLAKNITRLIPGYTVEWSYVAWGFALLLSLLWLLIIFTSRRSPWRGSVHWACGVVLIWGLFVAFLVPWFDYGKSYASVAGELRKALPQQMPSCIASRHVGAAQRAAFDYHAGVVTHRGNSGKDCNWLLVQGTPRGKPSLDGDWQTVWSGGRPGDKSERYYLFKR